MVSHGASNRRNLDEGTSHPTGLASARAVDILPHLFSAKAESGNFCAEGFPEMEEISPGIFTD
jgi:hypothetical protein